MELTKEVKRAVRKAVADEERESTEEGKRAVRAEGERSRALLAELEREEANGEATGSKGLQEAMEALQMNAVIYTVTAGESDFKTPRC